MAHPSGYEFTAEQNETLGGLTQLMQFFAYTLYLVGGLQAIFICTTAPTVMSSGWSATTVLLAVLLAGLMAMGLGMVLKNAATHFKQIIDTEGNDVDHLLHGMRKLKSFFRLLGLMAWLLAVALLVALSQSVVTGGPNG